MFIAIQTDQVYWLAGQPGVSEYTHKAAQAYTAKPVVPYFSRKGAGWPSELRLPSGNLGLEISFNTLRTFSSIYACRQWEANWINQHPWFGTLLRYEQDPDNLTPTYAAWGGANAVLQPGAAARHDNGLALWLNYTAFIPGGWTALADYVPSAVNETLSDGLGHTLTDDNGNRIMATEVFGIG